MVLHHFDQHTARLLSGEDSSLSHASLGKIIGTGMLLGVVHVLTGPDHLSALAAMTTSSSWKAFSLGLRWGCGHSIGLVIMAFIFFAAGKSFNLHDVGVYCNYIVGVFMIALGAWTIVHVKRKYRAQLKEAQLVLVATSQQRSSGNNQQTTLMLAHMERVPSNDSERPHSQRNSAFVDVVHQATPSPTTSFQLLTMDADCAEDKSDGMVHDLELQEKDANSNNMAKKKKKCCCSAPNMANPTTQRVSLLNQILSICIRVPYIRFSTLLVFCCLSI